MSDNALMWETICIAKGGYICQNACDDCILEAEAIARKEAKAEGIREGMKKAASMLEPIAPNCKCVDCAVASMYAETIRTAAGDAL